MATITDQADQAPMPLDEKGETKKGPGRPAGSPNKVPAQGRTSANVHAALGVMQGFYDFIAMGVSAIDSNAARDVLAKTATLQATNRTFFEADPKLAARIAKLGAQGGTTGFIMANVIALGPILVPVAQEATPLIRGMLTMYFPRFFGRVDSAVTDSEG